MEIREYTAYNEADVLRLYASVGWTAYTADPEALRQGFAASLLTLAAYEGETLVGLIRAVGDGHTIVFVQDLLVLPGVPASGDRLGAPAGNAGQIPPCASNRAGNGQHGENRCVLQIHGVPGDVRMRLLRIDEGVTA